MKVLLPVNAISVLSPGPHFSGQSTGPFPPLFYFGHCPYSGHCPSSSYTVSLPPGRFGPPESKKQPISPLDAGPNVQGCWLSLSDHFPASYYSRAAISQHLPKAFHPDTGKFIPSASIERPPRSVEMAQQLKMLSALKQDQGSVTNTHICLGPKPFSGP